MTTTKKTKKKLLKADREFMELLEDFFAAVETVAEDFDVPKAELREAVEKELWARAVGCYPQAMRNSRWELV